MVKNFEEKRIYKRQKIQIAFRYQVIQTDKFKEDFVPTVTQDISAGGLAFISVQEFLMGARIRIELAVPGLVEPLLLMGAVVRIERLVSEKGYSIGVLFLEISEADRKTLFKCLEGLDLFILLSEAKIRGASDVHFTVGRPPIARIQGRLLPLSRDEIKPRETETMMFPLLQPAQIENLMKNRELDFAFSPDINSRYRINLHWQKGFLEAAFRSIPTEILTPKELGLPEAVEDFAFSKHGLILVSGPTNSGKTTTLSSMVEMVNRKNEAIIISIENPIEYVHTSKKSIIKQRELGVDTLSYAEALKRSLRQDPDIIVVGELLDLECVLSALQAAETGHLVMTSIHSANAVQALERIMHMFPVEHKDEICLRLSACLVGVVSQILLPSTNNRDKQVLATEVLVATNAVKHNIRSNKFFQLHSIIQTGGQYKMQTLEKSLDILFTQGLISGNTLTEALQDIASRKGEIKQA